MPRLPKNIVKRGTRYYYRSRIGGTDRRISLGGNLQEAKRRALLIGAAEHREILVEPVPEGLRFGEFANRWLAEYVRQSRNAAGAELAEQRLRKHTMPVLGAQALAAITATELRALRASLESKKLAALTVRHILSDVRCLFRYAVEVGELSQSPFRLSVLPRIPEVAPRRLSEDELQRVIQATPREHLVAVKLAVLTGLRWGELRRLEWRDVVWVESPHLVLDRTKSGKVRRVPLVPEAVAVLTVAQQVSRSRFVLPSRPLRTIEFVAPMREALGFYWVFHQLRHTFASRWLDSGGSKEALQKILGHSTITMTERYGRLSDDAVFAEARGRSLGRPVEGGTGGGTVAGTPVDFGETKTS